MSPTALHSMLSIALIVAYMPAIRGQIKARTYAQIGPSGVVFADDLVFESTAVSTISCAAGCSQHPNCVSFTFSRSTGRGTCRGHSKVMTPLSVATPDPGARLFYFLDELSWLGSSCISNLFCPALDDVHCHNSTCTCTPGYFLSASRSQCMKDCPSEFLGTSFVGYFHLGLRNRNDRSVEMSQWDDCKQACLNETSFICLTVEFHLELSSNGLHECLLSASTVQEPDSLIPDETGWIYYQRTCQ